jgi:predicted DNA-binding helix-hairpin-helix protein
LLWDYGFDLEELPFAGEGNLPIDVDPKMAWAKANLSEVPLEVNKADRRDLMRIPGVGPVGAKAIMDARRKNNLCSVEDLKNLGVPIGRAAPFILLDGQRPAVQLGLWN